MKQAGSVLEVMGEYALMFVEVSPTRKHFKFLRNKGKMLRMYKTWDEVVPAMQYGVNYYCLLTKTIPAESKSEHSFQIMGILAGFDSFEDAEEANRSYFGTHKYIESTEDKLKWTKSFAQALRDRFEEEQKTDDYSYNTLETLMEITL